MGPAQARTRPVQKSPSPPPIVTGRVSRLIRMVNLLQSTERCTAERLARHLGVSRRTVFGDLKVLQSAGVPLVSPSSSAMPSARSPSASSCTTSWRNSGPRSILYVSTRGRSQPRRFRSTKSSGPIGGTDRHGDAQGSGCKLLQLRCNRSRVHLPSHVYLRHPSTSQTEPRRWSSRRWLAPAESTHNALQSPGDAPPTPGWPWPSPA